MKSEPIFAFSLAAASPCIDLPAGGNMWPFMDAGRHGTLGSVFQVFESLCCGVLCCACCTVRKTSPLINLYNSYCYNTVKSINKNYVNTKEWYLPT